jgi:pyrrolidone-carboxylate peptidase
MSVGYTTRTLLLTGFAPFTGFADVNPSFSGLRRAQAAGLLPGEADGARIVIAELPVTYADAGARLAELVREHRPDAGVAFGAHSRPGPDGGDSRMILIERTAHNADGTPDDPAPDNAGVARTGEPIDPAAPPTRPTTLPTDRLLAALCRAGVDAEPSDDAGRYLCNHVFFVGRGLLGRRPFGFIHVPRTDDIGGALALDDLARAQALIAREVLARIADTNPAPG